VEADNKDLKNAATLQERLSKKEKGLHEFFEKEQQKMQQNL
jgi:hypothetical protein